MRSEFEKYIREQSGFTSNFEVGCNGQYKSDLMHFMFITWQHQQSKVDELTQLYAKELFNKKVVAKKAAKKIVGLQLKNDELQKRVEQALFEMNQRKLELREGCDGYKDPVEICQSEGVEIAIQLLKQVFKVGKL